jgi:hypothetical protein
VAVTAADERPFHSMAAHREKGAAEALGLLHNASHVSSFLQRCGGGHLRHRQRHHGGGACVSAAVGAECPHLLLSVGVTALISGLTIGGKALGKTFAISRAPRSFSGGAFLHLFHRSSKDERNSVHDLGNNSLPGGRPAPDAGAVRSSVRRAAPLFGGQRFPDRRTSGVQSGDGGADGGDSPLSLTPKDRLVFDVGHQCYVHKALTGRRELFSTLRQFNGRAVGLSQAV